MKPSVTVIDPTTVPWSEAGDTRGPGKVSSTSPEPTAAVASARSMSGRTGSSMSAMAATTATRFRPDGCASSDRWARSGPRRASSPRSPTSQRTRKAMSTPSMTSDGLQVRSRGTLPLAHRWSCRCRARSCAGAFFHELRVRAEGRVFLDRRSGFRPWSWIRRPVRSSDSSGRSGQDPGGLWARVRTCVRHRRQRVHLRLRARCASRSRRGTRGHRGLLPTQGPPSPGPSASGRAERSTRSPRSTPVTPRPSSAWRSTSRARRPPRSRAPGTPTG